MDRDPLVVRNASKRTQRCLVHEEEWSALPLLLSFFVLELSLLSKGHGVINEALTCQAGGWGLNPRQDQEFLQLQKNSKMCSNHHHQPCELSLPMAWSNPVISGDLLQEGQKEWNHGIAIEIDLLLQKEISMKNPNSTILVAKHRYKCII